MNTDNPNSRKRVALGRGLGALISSKPVPVNFNKQANQPTASPSLYDGSAALKPQEVPSMNPAIDQKGVLYIDINKITNNPKQPREDFKEAELNELSESIKTLGVLQPILLRKGAAQGTFEIIAGERRFRASQRAGLTNVPAIVKELNDRETLEIALVENLQRENLNPVEEATAYDRLAKEFELGQQEIAARVGKDRATIANALRLLKLPSEVLLLLKSGEISVGHAKAILGVKDPQGQITLAKKVVKDGLSVRALEAIISQVVVLDSGKVLSRTLNSGLRATKALSAFPEIVERLRKSLGTKVTIRHHKSGRGRIEIDYFSEQELERVVDKICSDAL